MAQSTVLSIVLGITLALTASMVQAADLCGSLRTAWLAARQSPESARGLKLAGADQCSFSNRDLDCTWEFEDARHARQAYRSYRRTAAACMRPLGLRPKHKILHGVETTSLEIASDAPNVAVFYPGGPTVTISIVTSP